MHELAFLFIFYFISQTPQSKVKSCLFEPPISPLQGKRSTTDLTGLATEMKKQTACDGTS